MVIGGYSIMALGGYSIMAIGGYSINGYSWLFHCKPLVVILLVVFYGYFINGY